MRKIQTNNQEGFSLVETLVAITILLIVITGPLTIGTTTARSTSFSSEQVVAFFLAQEGAELAQKARDDYLLDYYDNNTARPQPWTDFKDIAVATGKYRFCFQAAGCGLELQGSNVTGSLKAAVSCSNVNDCLLYYNSSGERDRYTYVDQAENADGSGKTKYTRVIKMTPEGSDQVKVVSTVTWRTGSQRAQQTVVAETFLFNVYGQ